MPGLKCAVFCHKPIPKRSSSQICQKLVIFTAANMELVGFDSLLMTALCQGNRIKYANEQSISSLFEMHAGWGNALNSQSNLTDNINT